MANDTIFNIYVTICYFTDSV